MESRLRQLDAALRDSLHEAGSLLAAAVFPHFCCGCGKEGLILCDGCAAEARTPFEGIFVCPGCGARTPAGGRCGARKCETGPLDGLTSAAPYGRRMLRELVRLYKYERVEEAGEELRRLFAAFIGRHRHVIASYAAVAVVPVPMHPFREAYRGFNQAEVLASVLAAEAGLPLRRNMLKRGFRFAAQAKLADDRERSRNARGSVVAAASASRGAYLLVDDVVTTGATLEACALALKAAGATEVRAITLLRGSTLHNSSVSR